MLAVAWVIFNRSQRYKWSVRETILKPLHFSCFNHDDPNRDKLLVAHTWDRFNWAAADTVVELFEDHRTTDPTMGSTHYYRPGTVQPEWGRGHPGWREKTVIGNHVFGVAD
jgi:spore germination cell wall hydrolase CwlJ-like protein